MVGSIPDPMRCEPSGCSLQDRIHHRSRQIRPSRAGEVVGLDGLIIARVSPEVKRRQATIALPSIPWFSSMLRDIIIPGPPHSCLAVGTRSDARFCDPHGSVERVNVTELSPGVKSLPSKPNSRML